MPSAPDTLPHAKNVYQCTDPLSFTVTDQMKATFKELGYILVRGLFTADEMKKIKESCDGQLIADKSYGIPDPTGKALDMALWQHPGQDVLGMVARCERVVNSLEALLGDEVYHYHSKLMMKHAKTGGGICWHQDYGYWYKNGNLYPDMGTTFLAIDPSTEENGCLQIIEGSHRCGRVDHKIGEGSGQQGADMERVDDILKHSGLRHVKIEQQPGDALFFHCNVLHTSTENKSEKRRYMLSLSYNTKHNNPTIEHHHPRYTPLKKVPNTAVGECTNIIDATGKDFIDPSMDQTVVGHKEIGTGKKVK